MASLLLTEEALFTWAFRRWVSLLKHLQEFKELERLIYGYTPIILGSWKPRDQNFELEYLWNQERDITPKQRPD